MIGLNWNNNEQWTGYASYLRYEVDTINKLIVKVNRKSKGFRSDVIVYIDGKYHAGHVYDIDLEVLKLKSLITAKEWGFDLSSIKNVK